MNNYDPLEAGRRGLDEEDMVSLGQEDTDDRTGTTDDAMEAADAAEPYIAPIDPPVVSGGRDNIEVAQGFAASSEGEEDTREATGDDDITERVTHLLRTDAATSNLQLDVDTIDGVVYLRGAVPSLDDTDLASDVAARVPGVVDVVDEMTVQT